MLEGFLKRASWTDIIMSIIFVIFGVLLVSRPEATVGAISIIVGIIFIAMGVLKLIEYFTSEDKQDYLLTIALVAVFLGVIMLFASDALIAAARVLLGAWIMASGIMDIQTAISWREVKSPYWTATIVFGLLIFCAGVFIVATPNSVVTFVGIATIVYGVLDIIDRVIFMSKMKNVFDNK